MIGAAGRNCLCSSVAFNQIQKNASILALKFDVLINKAFFRLVEVCVPDLTFAPSKSFTEKRCIGTVKLNGVRV